MKSKSNPADGTLLMKKAFEQIGNEYEEEESNSLASSLKRRKRKVSNENLI